MNILPNGFTEPIFNQNVRIEKLLYVLQVKKRMRLEGSELEEYLRKEKEKEAEAAKIKAEQAKM